LERFTSRVDQNGPIVREELGPCHVFIGQTDHHGYGLFAIDGRKQKAHRVAWFFAKGAWPEPCALHKCDNPSCVRIDHLFEGTKKQNTADMVSKGRARFVPHYGEHHGMAKLSDLQVERIRERAKLETQASLARAYGVSATQICAIVRFKARRGQAA